MTGLSDCFKSSSSFRLREAERMENGGLFFFIGCRRENINTGLPKREREREREKERKAFPDKARLGPLLHLNYFHALLDIC